MKSHLLYGKMPHIAVQYAAFHDKGVILLAFRLICTVNPFVQNGADVFCFHRKVCCRNADCRAGLFQVVGHNLRGNAVAAVKQPVHSLQLVVDCYQLGTVCADNPEAFP